MLQNAQKSESFSIFSADFRDSEKICSEFLNRRIGI